MKVHNAFRDVVYAIEKEGIVLNPKQIGIAYTSFAQAELWALDVVVTDAQNPSHCGPQQLNDPSCLAAAAAAEAD